MGTFSKGILGGFKGTVGPVVGSRWKGQDILRSKPGKRSGTPTENQQKQQVKFGLAVRFMQCFTGLVGISFQHFSQNMSGFNNAVAYTIEHAITGIYPNLVIDYGMVLISRGELPNVINPTAAAAAAHKINFAWTNNAGLGKAEATDRAILVAYCEDMTAAVYTTGSAARVTGADTLDATQFAGQNVQTYIGFISANGKTIANSIYTGMVTVS